MKAASHWRSPQARPARHGASAFRPSPAPVTWEGPGQPIVLKVHGPAGEVAVPMVPKRALELAQELMEPAVASIKIAQWGKPWSG